MAKHVSVGCGALGFNAKGEVLLLKRHENASTDPGVWARPGGRVEFGETAEAACRRELLEETGAAVADLAFSDLFETIADAAHWVALGFVGTVGDATAVENREPDKHDAIGWFPLDGLPTKLAPHTRAAIDKYRSTHPGV